MAAKLTNLTHKIAIQLHLVAESRIVWSSHSRLPVRKLFGYTLECDENVDVSSPAWRRVEVYSIPHYSQLSLFTWSFHEPGRGRRCTASPIAPPGTKQHRITFLLQQQRGKFSVKLSINSLVDPVPCSTVLQISVTQKDVAFAADYLQNFFTDLQLIIMFSLLNQLYLHNEFNNITLSTLNVHLCCVFFFSAWISSLHRQYII